MVSIIGLLLLFCVWQVCCYPVLRLCGWYCTYWGTIIRMAFDACRGIDPRELHGGNESKQPRWMDLEEMCLK